MSLRRDERKPWMGIRYSVASPNMLSRQAFLGMERGFGTGATALTMATEQTLRRFCTSGRGEKHFDAKLFEHLRSIQRQLVIDSASDERLIARQMVEGLRCDGIDVLCPNQSVETLDKAHGSTRMLSRTFTKDPVMKDFLETFIFGRSCFVTVVHNSSDINDRFEHYVSLDEKDEAIAGHIRNLGLPSIGLHP